MTGSCRPGASSLLCSHSPPRSARVSTFTSHAVTPVSLLTSSRRPPCLFAFLRIVGLNGGMTTVAQETLLVDAGLEAELGRPEYMAHLRVGLERAGVDRQRPHRRR